MLIPTRGIVINTVKYGDTSLIARIYTEEKGMQSYIVNGVRKGKSRTQAAMLQPLSLLDMVVYYRPNKAIQRAKEIKFAYTFQSIPFEITKSTIALFMTEILHKTIREEEENKALFTFLFNSIQWLDQSSATVRNFPIVFLLQLSQWLGFHPQSNFNKGKNGYFDMREGLFVEMRPPHSFFVGMPLSRKLAMLIDANIMTHQEVKTSRGEREELLQTMLNYYRLHSENFKEVKSVAILKEVFG